MKQSNKSEIFIMPPFPFEYQIRVFKTNKTVPYKWQKVRSYVQI